MSGEKKSDDFYVGLMGTQSRPAIYSCLESRDSLDV
ncbi:MAG: hypothetical protein ACI9ON_001993 [Limisphaerales bacterium]|jgi:hypothetical protein